MNAVTRILVVLAMFIVVTDNDALAQRERFERPVLGENLGIWRITNDPKIRDWANYHNCQCWSPDGRYVCYSHWGSTNDDGYGSKSGASIHVFDLHGDKGKRVDQGINPRWAKQHNWLFYARFNPKAGELPKKGTEVMKFDADAAKVSHVTYGVEVVGGTDADDRWLYGARRFRGQTPQYRSVRIRIGARDSYEYLPDVTGSQMLPNPQHPVFFTRHDHKKEPFNATRYWYRLDGTGKRIFVPTVQQCHMGWLGNGEYFLLGNGLIRGFRWGEPFPNNVHFLASVGVGDVSPCGRSGRYACGDHTVADLRSGDGWRFMSPLSVVCYPVDVADNSGIYDADPKGSPDGTKISFVSNYDLKEGPVARLTKTAGRKDDALHVDSTEGFPETGSVVVHREVVGYRRKTATTFEGLTRQRYNTMLRPAKAGRLVTSFEARCLTEKQWKQLPGPSPAMRKSIRDMSSPLMRQRQTDLYIAVVRRPDRPYLRLKDGTVQLVPGEDHYETFGYHILLDGKKITQAPLRPRGALALAKPGRYQTVAVEWSGLESEPSLALALEQPAKLGVLADPPNDFSWTSDRWLVKGRSVTKQAAAQSPEAVREIVHRHDGVIHREWYSRGAITRRHDLNPEGKAIRRLAYENGKLAVREYYDREGNQVSTETFDTDGFITQSVKYRGKLKYDQWFYDRGMPVRRIIKEREEYRKQGDNWVRAKMK